MLSNFDVLIFYGLMYVCVCVCAQACAFMGIGRGREILKKNLVKYI